MKFNHILFPIDFSAYNQNLNTQVEWLATRYQSRVTLLHVFEIPSSWYGGADAPMLSGQDIVAFAEAEKKRLQEYKIAIPESQVERVSLEGGAACHIAEWAKDHAVDLIVMGTHGFGALRRMLLGSVAMKVLHDVECPIWMQTTKLEGTLEINGIKTIICPIELTGETVPLLHYAGEVAATLGARVRLVHVIPEQDVRAYKYFDGDFHQRLRDTALEEIARKQKEAGTDFPVTITKGNIASDVAELALDQNAELILTGRGKARSMFGSLRTHVTDIIREAPCPVLSYSMDWLAREFHPALSEPVTAHLPVVSLA